MLLICLFLFNLLISEPGVKALNAAQKVHEINIFYTEMLTFYYSWSLDSNLS